MTVAVSKADAYIGPMLGEVCLSYNTTLVAPLQPLLLIVRVPLVAELTLTLIGEGKVTGANVVLIIDAEFIDNVLEAFIANKLKL